MTIVIGLLTLVLILDALLLILLVLIQLPKKDAGAGVAFGGGATDALFGAGSGSALTKITKYAAITFLGLSMVVALMQIKQSRRSETGIEAELERAAKNQTAPAVVPAARATNPFTTLPAPVVPEGSQQAAPANTQAAPVNTQAAPTLQLNPAPANTQAQPPANQPPGNP